MGGNAKAGRRRFGRIRKLASGRWQARYKAQTKSTGLHLAHSPRNGTQRSG